MFKMFSLPERLRFLDENYSKNPFKVSYLHPSSPSKVWKDWKTLNQNDQMRVNLRELFYDEIVLDFDLKENENWQDKASDVAIELFLKNYYFSVWFTGSKGIHAHLTFPELKNFASDTRKRARKWFCEGKWHQKTKKYECDLSKQTGLIAIEGKPHFKTHRPKKMVIEYYSELPNILPEECKVYAFAITKTNKKQQASFVLEEFVGKNIECPFHLALTGRNDTKPSMHVYPDGFAHCFGCRAHVTHRTLKSQIELNKKRGE